MLTLCWHVDTTCDDVHTTSMHVDTAHVMSCVLCCAMLCAHRRVVGARCELGVRRAEAEPSDRVGAVRDKVLHRRHRRLKEYSSKFVTKTYTMDYSVIQKKPGNLFPSYLAGQEQQEECEEREEREEPDYRVRNNNKHVKNVKNRIIVREEKQQEECEEREEPDCRVIPPQ